MSKKVGTKLPLENQAAFADALKEWFALEAKDYPWRRTRDPYAVLVSEIMLQQTQVATVLGRRYFENWMALFPDPAALAAAPEDTVLRAWEGLGYYRRARNLKKAAEAIVDRHAGVFPTQPAQILVLPGVGRYTAGAVASFALELPEAVVDANIARVLARLFDFRVEVDSTKGLRQLWDWAEALVPTVGAREYNSALMELGQTICDVRDPRCADCPVAEYCLTQAPAELPLKKPKTKTVFQDEHVAWIHQKGKVLLQQERGARRQGLWKLPAAELFDGWEDWPEMARAKYSITHHRVTLITHEAPAAMPMNEAPTNCAWLSDSELEEIGMPSPYRRALHELREGTIL